jgi:hypothetical protein
MLVTPTLVLSHERSDSEPSHSNESDILPNNLIETVTTPQPSKLVVPMDSALYTVSKSTENQQFMYAQKQLISELHSQ